MSEKNKAKLRLALTIILAFAAFGIISGLYVLVNYQNIFNDNGNHASTPVLVVNRTATCDPWSNEVNHVNYLVNQTAIARGSRLIIIPATQIYLSVDMVAYQLNDNETQIARAIGINSTSKLYMANGSSIVVTGIRYSNVQVLIHVGKHWYQCVTSNSNYYKGWTQVLYAANWLFSHQRSITLV